MILFKPGDKVKVRDDAGLWIGEIGHVDLFQRKAYVIYNTNQSIKHRWFSFDDLIEAEYADDNNMEVMDE